MPDILYRWPDTAKFGRRVAKEKIYEHSGVNAAVRERFVIEVQRITWAYKLAETTINLVGTPEVPEIQVFTIDAKTDDVSTTVLTAIDRAVPFPIIFEMTRTVRARHETRMVAAYKQLGAAAPKLSAYYTTDWVRQDSDRGALPTAISLPALYGALLQPMMPIFARGGEEMSGVADRLEAVNKLERDIASLERRIRTEPQLNRKVDLRRMLKMKQHELATFVES